MNTTFFCLLTVTLFINSGKNSSNTSTHNNNPKTIHCLKSDNEVTMSYKEFKNEKGNVYRTRYTLTNNTGTAKRVTWTFTGYYNCSSSGGFSGVEFLIGYGVVDITTFTQIDEAKNWSEGSYKIEWK